MDARQLGDVAEGAVALIPVQGRMAILEIGRGAEGAPDAIQAVVDAQVNILRPADIVSNGQVKISIVVDIDEDCCRTPSIGF